MSQTETALLFVLGFSLASLLALFFLRLMWMAAVRVGARRMQRQVPSTLAELQADRTRLRAENAMLAQRLGAELQDAKLDAAERLAEVNRHRNRVLAAETAERVQTGEADRLKARVQDLEQALEEAKLREQELRRTLAAQEDSLRKVRRKTRAATPDTPAPPPVDERELRLRQRIDKLNELARGRQAGPPRDQDQDATSGEHL
jgi:chromosome segregation ATPase